MSTHAILVDDFVSFTYKVGDEVPADGYYICVPCGYKKYLKAGSRFPSCLMCFGRRRKIFRKGFELWEKI